MTSPSTPRHPFFDRPVAAEVGATACDTPAPSSSPPHTSPGVEKKSEPENLSLNSEPESQKKENGQKNLDQKFQTYSAKWPLVLSYGGGDNSRALAIEMVRRGVIPDLIIFSDTGGERPETYAANLEFDAWLKSKGFPGITVVSDGRKTLEQEVLEANTLPSIVFGFKSCSDKFKIRPIDRFLREWGPARNAWENGGKVVKLVGYDAMEGHRVKDYDSERFLVRYPLIEWGWNRSRCKLVVKEAGFTPSKSACFFCPSTKKGEVLRLKTDHPELFERVVAMEKNATVATEVKGLGRTWSWTALAAADEEQFKLFEDLPDEKPCGCYD